MIRRYLPMLVACATLAVPAGALGLGSDSDKLEAAAANLARMKAALKQVLGRAEQARSEKDVVKLNCVNEKLAQIKALINVAEKADISLHEAVAGNQGGDVSFSKIAIARTKVDGLRGESEQCIGQLAYMVDEKTTVEVEQPDNLPGRDDTSLRVARRGNNPANEVGQIGGSAGLGDYYPGEGRDRPFEPPPIVRPPAASPFE